MVYSGDVGRPGADGSEGDCKRMATSNLFWRLFAQTGSIDAYLAYRRLHAAPTAT
jgi:hypothetical protein